MRGLTLLEYSELSALLTSGERVFHGPTLEALMLSGRIREVDHDVDDAGEPTFRLVPSEAGQIALCLWPLNRCGV